MGVASCLVLLAVAVVAAGCGTADGGNGNTVTVTLTEGTTMAADLAPDGSALVLALQGSLWRLPVDGGRAERLTGWEVEATHVAWSPRGDLVAFQNFDDHYYHVWVMAPDGSGLRGVTSGPADHREPAWSPDGTRIAFSSDRGGSGSYDIWSAEVATGELKQWTHGAGEEHSPAWSPDGTRIAFVEGGVIRAVDQGGVVEELATDASGLVHAPSWAPDGRLAWQDRGRRLVVDGEVLVEGEDLFPFPVRWTGEGGFLHTADGAVRLRDAAGARIRDVPFEAELVLERPARRANTRRLDEPGPWPVRGIFAPTLSPDGERVAFVALNDLWVMEPGHDPVRLTDDAFIEWIPSWSPDGTRIYFNSDREGTGRPQLWSVEAAGGAVTRVTDLPDVRMIFPVLSPDGTHFAWIEGADQSLQLFDLATGIVRRVADQAYASNVGRPSWSPDGRYVAFADTRPFSRRFREGRNLIRVVEVATGTSEFHEPGPLPAQLSERFEAGPSWSPDGRWMAFTMNSVLHVIPVDARGTPTGEARQLTDHVADMPSWSPDSRSVLYLSAGRLRSVPLEGGAFTDIPVPLTWSRPAPPAETWIRAGGMWDGVRDELHPEVLIRVEGARIAEIRPFDPEEHGEGAAEAAGARFIDASHLVAMPGLWDAHVHPRVQDFAGGWWAVQLAYGITSVVSNGTSTYHTLLTRESLEAGRWVGPRMLVGPIWDGTRTFYGHHRSVGSDEALALELEMARELGMDYLKAYVRLPASGMKQVAELAAEMGIPSGSHFLSPGIQVGLGGTTHLSATQRLGYSWAQSPGGTSYQDVMALYTGTDYHLSSHHIRTNYILGDDPEILDDPRFRLLMPRNYVFQVQQQASRPPNDAERARIREDVQIPAALFRAGGVVTLGSDTPLSWPALGLHAQLRAFAYELTPHEALQSATVHAARYAHLEHEVGTLERGKIADVILVRGNPLEDVANAGRVEVVVKGGVVHTVDDILRPFRGAEGPPVGAARP